MASQSDRDAFFVVLIWYCLVTSGRKEWQMRVYDQCAGIFCESQWLADSLIKDTGISPNKVYIIDKGINVKPELTYHLVGEKSKQDKIILFIGRDFFRKGGHLVVKAYKLLRKNYSKNVKLIISSTSPNNFVDF